jgi:2-methylcitrate dehydratase PrpD
MARDLIIDGIACGQAAIGSPIAESLAQWRAGAVGQHRVLGSPSPVDARTAVMSNGTLIHALDFDDIPHFAAVELPPAFAAIEGRDATGEEFVTAVVVGFEVAARITAMLAHGRPQHPIGMVGAIGSAAVTAKLLGLDQRQTTAALGIAASMGAGLTENFGTFTKPLHAGRAAEAGFTAATLARVGWTAEPAVYEGRKGFLAAYCDSDGIAEAFHGQGDDFWITRVPADLSAGSPLEPSSFPPRHSGRAADFSRIGLGAPSDQLRGGPNLRRGPSFKPWPACGGNNAVLTAMFGLLGRPGFDRDRVSRFEIVVPSDPERGAVFRTNPSDALQGKFSLPYGVAAAWLDGEVTVSSYEEPTYCRIRSAGLLERITLRVDPTFLDQAADRPPVDDCNWASLIATMEDGSVHVSWAFNRGVELSSTAVREKFTSITAERLGLEEATSLLEELNSIETAVSVESIISRSLA